MIKTIRDLSHALDRTYDRLGFVRANIWLSNLSLVFWYITTDAKEHQKALDEVRGFDHLTDWPFAVMRLDLAFTSFVGGLVFVGLSMPICYLLTRIPQTWLMAPHPTLVILTITTITFWILVKKVPLWVSRRLPLYNSVFVAWVAKSQ